MKDNTNILYHLFNGASYDLVKSLPICVDVVMTLVCFICLFVSITFNLSGLKHIDHTSMTSWAVLLLSFSVILLLSVARINKKHEIRASGC